MDPEKLRKSYVMALEGILEEARKFEDLWDYRPDTRIIVVDALIDQDESIDICLIRKNGTFLFDGLNAEEAATYLRTHTPNGRFYPEKWKKAFYENIKLPLGKYLAEKEIKNRLV